LTPRGSAPPGAGPAGRDAWDVVAQRTEGDGWGQARLLLRMVDEMLREARREPCDVRAIVVGMGPGTFTGVRIAVATARALSLALPAPVTGVSTLAALASCAAGELLARGEPDPVVGLLVPVIDARRGQVFFGVYKKAVGGAGWSRSAPFGVCDRAALADAAVSGGTGEAPGAAALVIAEDRQLVGELPAGVEFLQGDVQPSSLLIGQECLHEPGDRPEGVRLVAWLADAMADKVAVVPETVKPVYVRSPDADIHIAKMKDPWAELPMGSSRGQRP
jgi:tRNA threonylcarbamoyl adenosine modification protein YeaZ